MADGNDAEPPTRHVEDSAAYRAGLAAGLFTRMAVVVFAFGIGGVAIGGNVVPERWQNTVVIASLVLGSIAALGMGLALRNAFWGAMGIYVLLVGVGSVLQSVEPRPTGALVAVAVGTIVAALAFMAISIRAGRRSRELERLLFSESTSIAFFVTMIGAITYALLEAWLDAPKLSMWVVWSVGMGTWAVGSIFLSRRYS